MSTSVLLYRLYRLRRLIAVTITLPTLAVLAIAAVKGPAAFVFLVFAIGVPLAHALRYPVAWTETVAVSLVTTILLGLAGTIGPDVGLLGLVLRVLGLGLLGAGLFMVLSARLPVWLDRGPARVIEASATRRSRLTPDELRRAVPLYPGRSDDRVECGEADADGIFTVRIRHEAPEILGCAPEPFEVRLFAQVLTDTPERHEVMAIEEDGEEPSFTRYEFLKRRRGTLVRIYERGAPMPVGHAAGFWLQDFIADFLTDEIERAEGRPQRSNRFAGQDQLLVDLTQAVLGLVRGRQAQD